jgi:class 3 adenylate cyclase/CheY-like chemotaxis protein
MATTTIVFTDITGSTESLIAAGDRAGVQAIADHLRASREVIEQSGGKVTKTLGDGVMAVFDSASEAVLAAVALQQDNDMRGRSGTPPFGLRVGIHVGDVVDEDVLDDSDVFGAAVVGARRLCDGAESGQIVVSDLVRLLAQGHEGVDLTPLGTRTLKGLAAPMATHAARWEPLPLAAPVRVVIAEDSPFVRAGLVRVLGSEGYEVVAEVEDHDALLDAVRRHTPDLVVTDIRMPPTHTDEGLRAAEAIRTEWPGTGVLVLSQHVDAVAAQTLLEGGTTSIGYLLKERVSVVDVLLEACRAVLDGEAVIDPLV